MTTAARLIALIALLAMWATVPPPPAVAQPDAPTAVRLGGPDPIGTAAAVARDAFPDGATTVHLARVDVLADALAAGSLADGPVLLTPSCGAVPADVMQAVADLDPDTVVALGGEQAVCDELLVEAAQGRPTERIAGASRLDTAAAIADRAFPDGASSVYVADAGIGPDAIVGGTLTEGPILLAPGAGVVPDVVLSAIQAAGPDATWVLGGTAAVKDDVAIQLSANPHRLAGPSRVQTAIAVSRHQFGLGSSTGAIATSAYLTDDAALAEAVAAGAATDGPVLLVPTCDALPATVAAELLRLRPDRVVAVGGTEVLCDAVLDAAVDAATPDELEVDPQVIPVTTADAALREVTADTVVLEGSDTSRDLAVGDIVALEPDPDLLPAGWIVEVLDVAQANAAVTLTVRAADPEQVLTRGTLRLPIGGPRFDQATASLSIDLCREDVSCHADGAVSAELTVDPFVDLDIDQRIFTLGSQLSGAITASIQLRERQSFTGPQAYRTLPAIPIPAASIPVGPFSVGAVLVPALVMEADGDVSVTGRFSGSVSVDGTIGATWVDGDLSMLPREGAIDGGFDLSAGGRARITPQVHLEGLVTFGLGPLTADGQLSAGAEVGVRTPITVAVDTAGTVRCDLSVAGFVDLEATLFGREVSGGLELPFHEQDLCPLPPEGSLRADGFGDVDFGDSEGAARGWMFRRHGLPVSSFTDEGRCTDGRTITSTFVSWGPATLIFDELDGVSTFATWIVSRQQHAATVSTERGTGIASTRQQWTDAYARDHVVEDWGMTMSIRRDAQQQSDFLLFFNEGADVPNNIVASGDPRCEEVFDQPRHLPPGRS